MAIGMKQKRKKYKNLITKKLMSLGLEDRAVSVQNGNKQDYRPKTGQDGKTVLEPYMRPTYQLKNPLRFMCKQILALSEPEIQDFLHQQAERPASEKTE
jgi:hypothetical protein